MKSFITQLKPFAFLTGISAGKVEKHPKNSKKATDTSSILVGTFDGGQDHITILPLELWSKK